jgi:phosphotransferase family enzyme
MAGLHGMFAGAGVEPELVFLDHWRTALTRDLPLPAVDELPRAWLHSDFHPSNVVFADDQVRAVLDFDVVHRGFRLEDIAYARPHPQPRPAIEHAQEVHLHPVRHTGRGTAAFAGREGIARTGREPARPRQVRVRDRGSPRPPDRGLSARRAPTATWSEAGHGGNPGLSPHSGIGDGRYTCQRRTTRCFPRIYREMLRRTTGAGRLPRSRRSLWCTSPHPLTCGFPKSPETACPQPLPPPLAPRPVHTDRQPGEAAQYTARCPAPRLCWR